MSQAPAITPIYAAVLALLYLALAWYLVLLKRLAVWRKDDFILRMWDRAQHARAHVQSYAIFGLLLMLLLELGGTGRGTLHLLGLMLLAGNAIHAGGFVWFPGSRKASSTGWVTITITYLVAIALLLWRALFVAAA